jgi:hypothetical protein
VQLAPRAAELRLAFSRAQQGQARRGGAALSGQISCPIYLERKKVRRRNMEGVKLCFDITH